MSASREKDQADFDLETFVDLFDTAMSSDNPAVKRALKNLLLISAMVNAENSKNYLQRGPLRRALDDINNIARRLERVENNVKSTFTPTPPGYNPNDGQVTWPVHNPNVSPMPGTALPPGTIWTTTNTGTSYTAPNSGAKSSTANSITKSAQAHMSVASLDNMLTNLETK